MDKDFSPRRLYYLAVIINKDIAERFSFSYSATVFAISLMIFQKNLINYLQKVAFNPY